MIFVGGIPQPKEEDDTYPLQRQTSFEVFVCHLVTNSSTKQANKVTASNDLSTIQIQTLKLVTSLEHEYLRLEPSRLQKGSQGYVWNLVQLIWTLGQIGWLVHATEFGAETELQNNSSWDTIFPICTCQVDDPHRRWLGTEKAEKHYHNLRN